MESTRLLVALLIVGTLTSTWARFVAENLEGSIVRETSKDSRRTDPTYPMRKVPNDEKRDEFVQFNEKIYDRDALDRLLRKNSRIGGKRRRSLRGEEKTVSERALEKMLEKAILKIITGDLSTADMLLLKSFNYSLEEVLAIREREFSKRTRPEGSEPERKIGNELTVDGEDSSANRVESYEKPSRKKEKIGKSSSLKSRGKTGKKKFDFDAYNRQAVYDYETAANRMASGQSDLEQVELSLDYENIGKQIENKDPEEVNANFDRSQEPHVVFKIRYDDTDFDSNEKSVRVQESKNRTETTEKSDSTETSTADFSTTTEIVDTTLTVTENNYKIFEEIPPLPVSRKISNFVNVGKNWRVSENENKRDDTKTEENRINVTDLEIGNAKIGNPDTDFPESETSTIEMSGPLTPNTEIAEEGNEEIRPSSEEPRRKSLYEGLEWVEDDVYRVIPEAMDFLNYYDASIDEMENETIDDSRMNETRVFEGNNEEENVNNDTIGYQNENPQEESQNQTQDDFFSIRNSPGVNLSAYQQFAIAHRRDQGQKAIEDIKLKVLAMTGRFNLSSNGNQVQRERLTMFPPICQLPKNTDAETWSDPFSMNMNFYLNLTSGDHIVAAKVRIYTLPQDNLTLSTGSTPNDEEEEEERKIRISIYFYTKSLKKHRSKKRLTDSIVIPLKSQGSHWALDVRQALRYWRQNTRNSHGLSNNHGLVIQVEDQDGRSLKPSQYIHQDACHVSDLDEDEKAYQRVPALFLQACSRYVRIVNEEPVTYVNCRRTRRH